MLPLTHAQRNAANISSLIQNEIISLCGAAIHEKLVAEIPDYWSLMADETHDSSEVEYLNICAWHVYNDAEVCGHFLGFLKLEKMHVQSIIDVMISSLQGQDLDFSTLVAQGYHVSSVMSSNIVGIQAKMQALYQNIIYMHCRSHVHNLAISSRFCDVSSIRNLSTNITKLTWFLGTIVRFLGARAKRKATFLNSAKELKDEN